MRRITVSSRVLSSTVAIALTLSGVLTTPSFAQSTSDNWGDPQGRRRGAATYVFNPPDQDAPGHRTAEEQLNRGSRSCPTVSQPITALVPSFPVENAHGTVVSGVETVWGLTTTAHPTFWFYIPYALTADVPFEFIVMDAEYNPVYETTFSPTTDSSGIIEITMPSSAPPLEVNQSYNWVLLVHCEAENPVFAEGWIERTAPNPALDAQLQQATPQQQVSLYASNGIWFDAFTNAAQLRQGDPQNPAIATEWTALLQAIGLGSLVDEPLVPCCTPGY